MNHPEPSPSPSRGGWAATRRSLLSRLRNWQDQRSWESFFEIYWRLLYGAAMRAGLSATDAEDVVQEVVIAVARKIPQFRYDPAKGTFKGWLLQILRRRIADHLRRRYRQAAPSGPGGGDGGHGGRPAVPVEIVVPPELERFWEEEWEDHVRDAALRRVRAQVDPLQFQIFDCYALKGWPVADVVRALGVTENQVYLAKSRVAARLREEGARLRDGQIG